MRTKQQIEERIAELERQIERNLQLPVPDNFLGLAVKTVGIVATNKVLKKQMQTLKWVLEEEEILIPIL